MPKSCRSVCSDKAGGYSMHLAWGALLSGSSCCIILIGVGITLHAGRFSLASMQTLVTCATSPPWGALVELLWEEWLLSSRSPRPSLVPTGNLGEPVLLPLRVPVPRFHHPGSVLFTNQHRHGVLPAVCRGEGSRPVGGGGVGLQRVGIPLSTSGCLDSPAQAVFLYTGIDGAHLSAWLWFVDTHPLQGPTLQLAGADCWPVSPVGRRVGQPRAPTSLSWKPALPLGDCYAAHHYWLNDSRPWEAFAQAKLFVIVFFYWSLKSLWFISSKIYPF